MMRTKALITAALIMLLALGASTALADAWDFEGTGQGDPIDGAVPFTNWQGTLYDINGNCYFSGYWGNDTDNWIQGSATQQDAYYYVSQGSWAYDSTQAGYWSGYFYPGWVYPPGDTAFGDWWTYGELEEGEFWGDLADD